MIQDEAEIKAKYRKANTMTAVGMGQAVGGGLVILLLGVIDIAIQTMSVFTGCAGNTSIFWLGYIAGGLLIWRGVYNCIVASAFRKLAKVIGDNYFISFINIERRLFWTRKKLLKNLRRQIDQGFWPNAQIDIANGVLLLDYDPVIAQPETGSTATNETLTSVNAIIGEIKNSARQITDDGLREQVERLSGIAEQIYTHVAGNPDKAGLIRQLSNYFLPTTLTLLRQYLDIQAHNVKTDNMEDALKKIREVMTTLEDVYKHQLDVLYSDKVMDVDVEIEVLQNMTQQGQGG